MESEDQELSQAFNGLFISKNGADVTFIVHGRELPAHKLIVSTRSPVLKAMIEGPMAPADQRYPIADPEITFEDFENFLKFLYTDECEIEQSNFKTMLYLASFYQVQHLHTECGHRAYRFLNDGNLFEFAELGLRYSPNSTLIHRCFRMINFYNKKFSLSYRADDDNDGNAGDDNVGAVVWISPELALEFVKYCKEGTRLSEDELFNKVFVWAQNYCTQHNRPHSPENLQATLAQIMPHFEPENFSPLTLAISVNVFKLIPEDQLIKCLVHHVVKAVDEKGNLPSYGGTGRRHHPSCYSHQQRHGHCHCQQQQNGYGATPSYGAPHHGGRGGAAAPSPRGAGYSSRGFAVAFQPAIIPPSGRGRNNASTN